VCKLFPAKKQKLGRSGVNQKIRTSEEIGDIPWKSETHVGSQILLILFVVEEFGYFRQFDAGKVGPSIRRKIVRRVQTFSFRRVAASKHRPYFNLFASSGTSVRVPCAAATFGMMEGVLADLSRSLSPFLSPLGSREGRGDGAVR
jgi:hypothetical protein